MSLLNGTREGLRIDATVVRERLLAAQYRNGYRALGVRLIEEYSQVAQLQMSRGNRLDKMRPQIDRQVVEGIIVPLAFFIRDRAEPEPLEALQSRAELFRDIVDKMATSGDPFSRTAEALKPLLRRSIEQTRPLVLEAFSYLAAPIESLKPTEVHRATALLHMFETLLRPDLDEKALQAVEPKEFAVLAKSVTQQFRPTGIGAYDRQQSIGAHPVPVDLPTGLTAIGYHPHKENRLELFRKEVRELIETGTAPDLRKALDYLRRFRRAVEEQRVKRGLVDTETSPYVGEIWLKESEDMVGILSYDGPGFGEVPIEQMVRKPTGGNHAEVEQALRRQLTNQALIYKAFHNLFVGEKDVALSHRRTLPTYLKTTYEKIEPKRNTLLIHLRNARLLLRRMEEFAAMILESHPSAKNDTVVQILTGLGRKVDQFLAGVDKSSSSKDLSRFAREHELVLKYLNTAILQSVNPWLERQTSELATEFEFREEEVVEAIRVAALANKMDWEGVTECRVNPIRGTLGCRALLKLRDGASKVVLCEFDRRYQRWKVIHFAPLVMDVVREELVRLGRILPQKFDEKFEQATFSLDEPACRFMLRKDGVTRVEATLILRAHPTGHEWQVVYLKWDDEVLIDRANPLAEQTA